MNRYARVGLLALIGALLAWNIVSGQIFWYIHERSVWLVALSIPFLLPMAFTQLRRARPASVDRVTLTVLTLPLVAGLLVPARPLGSAALASQATTSPAAVTSTVGDPSGALTLDMGSRVWDMPELSRMQRIDPQMRLLDGQRASLLGFVYRTPALPTDQFLVGRFEVRCCTADAVGVSFPVRYDRANTLAPDTWVQVDGTIHVASSSSSPGLVVEAEQVQVVPQPARPYIYP